MLLLLVLLLLSTRLSLIACEQSSSFHSNCSLKFNIEQYNKSNPIVTGIPVQFIANYNYTCPVHNLTAYYKIVSLDLIEINSHSVNDENTKSIFILNTTDFHFEINSSSTILLCVLLPLSSLNNSDHEGINSETYTNQICRRIHIGINSLYSFWNLPLKIFYLIGIFSMIICYTLFCLQHLWQKGWKKPELKPPVAKRLSIIETNHDTFENEKVRDDEMSEEDDDE